MKKSREGTRHIGAHIPVALAAKLDVILAQKQISCQDFIKEAVEREVNEGRPNKTPVIVPASPPPSPASTPEVEKPLRTFPGLTFGTKITLEEEENKP